MMEHEPNEKAPNVCEVKTLSGSEAIVYLSERKLFDPGSQTAPGEILVIRAPKELESLTVEGNKTIQLSLLLSSITEEISGNAGLEKLISQQVDPIGIILPNEDGSKDIVWVVEY